jgi:hypothetical protein
MISDAGHDDLIPAKSFHALGYQCVARQVHPQPQP